MLATVFGRYEVELCLYSSVEQRPALFTNPLDALSVEDSRKDAERMFSQQRRKSVVNIVNAAKHIPASLHILFVLGYALFGEFPLHGNYGFVYPYSVTHTGPLP